MAAEDIYRKRHDFHLKTYPVFFTFFHSKIDKKSYIDIAKPCNAKTLNLREYLEVIRDLDHHLYRQLH